MSIDRVSSVRAGESAENQIIQLVDAIEPVSDDVHVDGRARRTFSPTSDLPTVGLPLVERGTDIEIKTAIPRLSSGQRGRFYLRLEQHETLVERSALYLFAVCSPRPERPALGLKIVPAVSVDALIDSWIDPDGRQPYVQLSWSNIFDEDEIRERSEGAIRSIEEGDDAE